MQKHEKKNSKNFVPSNYCSSTIYTDLIGAKFNELTILSFPGHLVRKESGKDYKKAAVKVKCSCGVEFITDFQHVKHNRTLSCGHINRNYYIDPFACSVRSLFTRYKSRATKEDILFTLTQDEFRKIITSRCTYCGVQPSQQHSKCNCKSPIKHNGIDKVDPAKGYILSNAVPCCKICNRAKSDMSVTEFKQYINRLTEFASTKKLGKIGEPC